MQDRSRVHSQPGESQMEPANRPQKKPMMKVVLPDAELAESAPEAGGPSRPRPKMKVVGDERLTHKELKQRFASNLDTLLNIVGMTRKDAALAVGIPYKLMRRLASAGVSVSEERNAENLSKIADFFALSSVDLFWRYNLLSLVLGTAEGDGFLKKFREPLLAERERRLAEARLVDHDDVIRVGMALGIDEGEQPLLTGAHANKVAMILASPKGDNFLRVIDDYYELIRRHVADPDEHRGTGRRAAGT